MGIIEKPKKVLVLKKLYHDNFRTLNRFMRLGLGPSYISVITKVELLPINDFILHIVCLY